MQTKVKNAVLVGMQLPKVSVELKSKVNIKLEANARPSRSSTLKTLKFFRHVTFIGKLSKSKQVK